MIVFFGELLVHTDSNTFSDTSNGLNHNVPTANCYPSYQVLHNKESRPKKPSGSEDCNPITVLDDDAPDATEIIYIDLEKGNEAPVKKNCTASTQQAEAGILGSVAKSHSPYNNTQGPDPAMHNNRVAHPLFHALTKDDYLAPSVQPVPENRGIGSKAWYRTQDSYRIGNAAPVVQQKEISRNPSITMFNEERTKNMKRRNRDAPRFAMRVLNSKRKRTIGELGYDELISPAQIESPSENLTRIARKRRQRQERCDLLSQNTNTGDTQSSMDFDYAHGHESDDIIGKNVDLAVSPIVCSPLDGQETVARVSDQCSGPTVVYEPSPVSPFLSIEDHTDHLTMQHREDHSDGYMDAYGIPSTQSIDQDRETQKHNNSINATHASNRTSRKPKDRKPQISGPTNACGVFLPEKKPPTKRSNHGAFHCPRCDSQFTKAKGVNYHFEKCVATYGNPKSLKWNDHPSLDEEGIAERAVPVSQVPFSREKSQMSAAPEKSTQSNVPVDKQTISGGVPVESQITPTCVPIDTQTGVSAPVANLSIRAPLLDPGTQTPTLSNLPEARATIKDHTSSSYIESKVDHAKSAIKRHATAGKGLSQETLKRFRETGDWSRGMEVDQNADEAQDEETEVPNIAYHYFVQKHEWLETEEDAIESSLGPYHTMNEANAVAKVEVQSPQIDGFEGIRSKGWSYFYKEDEFGMQTHMATVLEVHIETVVHRSKRHSL